MSYMVKDDGEHELAEVYTCLGVLLNVVLDWNRHIGHIPNIISQRLDVLK